MGCWSLNMLVTAVFSQGVVFLDVMSGEEYDPLVLNANRPAPLKVSVQYDHIHKDHNVLSSSKIK